MRPSLFCCVIAFALGGALSFPATGSASPPANDNFADAKVIEGPSGSIQGTTLEATVEAGEPWHGDEGSIWYEWTAPATRFMRFIATETPSAPVVAVYTGSAVDALTPVASNLDFEPDTKFQIAGASFRAIAGTTYFVSVAGYDDGLPNGSVTLRWFHGKVVVGGETGEVLHGTSGRDYILAEGGNDTVYGRASADLIYGGYAGLGNFGGRDHLYGGRGRDELHGGGGHDALYGGAGSDRAYGDRGPDIFRMRDRTQDVIRGGGGVDSARIDGRLDDVANVELFF